MRICEVAGKEKAGLFPATGVWMFQVIDVPDICREAEWVEKIRMG